MNRFFLAKKEDGRPCPFNSAVHLCDKHIVKLAVEEVQMIVSALLNNGAPAGLMPETVRGTIHKGGYRNHPMTRWTGESTGNFDYAMNHAFGICQQFSCRYGKEHSAQKQLMWIREAVLHHRNKSYKLRDFIPWGPMTEPPRCVNQSAGRNLDLLDPKISVVEAYRRFYMREKVAFAEWAKCVSAPSWWPQTFGVEVKQ